MATIKEKIAGLYIAFFNRAADKEGLEYWETQSLTLGEDVAVKTLAAAFATHPKFTDLYDHLDNEEYVEAIYINCLGQAGDSEGINYWKGLIDKGVSRSDMVADFVSASLDFQRTDPQYASLSKEILDAAQERRGLLANKVEVSLEFVKTLGDQTNLDSETDATDADSLDNDVAYQASIKIISKITDEKETAQNVKEFLNKGVKIATVQELSEDELEKIIDSVPSLTIANDTEGTAYGEVNYTFTFDEDVSGFTIDDIDVTGGSKGEFTQESASLYTLVVTPDLNSTEEITVDVAANVAVDNLEQGNNAATQSVQEVNTNPALTREELEGLISGYYTSEESFSKEKIKQALYEANVSEITDMSYLFAGINPHGSGLDLSKWDVSSVTDMSSMFKDALLGFGDLSKWDVSSVTDMSSMFEGSEGEASVGDLSEWDVGNVINSYGFNTNSKMIYIPDAFEDLLLSITDDTEGVAHSEVKYTFIFNYDVADFTIDDIDVTGGSKGAFVQESAALYTLVVTPDFNSTEDIIVSVAANSVAANVASYLRKEAKSIQTVDTSLDRALTREELENLLAEYQENPTDTKALMIQEANTSEITDMSELFHNNTSFNLDISKWDVSNVSNMTFMFHNAQSFNQDISDWDVSSVTDMYGMFHHAESFNQDISGWDVGSVISYDLFAPHSPLAIYQNNIPAFPPLYLLITDNIDDTTSLDVFYTFTFNEAVTGFTIDDISVTGGTKGVFTEKSASVYTLVVTPDTNSTEDMIVDVAANVAMGSAGIGNTEAKSVQAVDTAKPSITITDDTEGAAKSDVTYTFTFDEDVSGFTDFDVSVLGGSKGVFTQVSDSLYTLVVTPDSGSGKEIIVEIAADAATDRFNNGNTEARSVQAVDTINPSLTITDDTEGTAYGEVKYTFTFDEDVSKFTVDDVTVTGGSKGVFTQVSDSLYTLVVTPDANSIEDITVDVAVNVALDSAENPNNAATQNVQKVNSNPALTREKLDTLIANYKSDPIDANAQVITEANVSEITDMSFLFRFDTTFDLDISNWDVSGVTDMTEVFSYTSSFNQDISSWDVSKVKDMTAMFTYATSFDQDISDWNLSNVTSVSYMFDGAQNFNQDIADWNVSKVTDMILMFYNAKNFNQDISSWDVSNVRNYDSFYTSSALEQEHLPAFSPLHVTINDDTKATAYGDVIYTFTFTQEVSDFVADDVTVTGGTKGEFTQVSATEYTLVVTPDANSTEDITVDVEAGVATDSSGYVNTPAIQSVQVVNTKPALTRAELDTLIANYDLDPTDANANAIIEANVSEITDMSELFYSNSTFNLDISKWDVSKVEDMSSMFEEAENFNQDISEWNIGSVTETVWMFTDAKNFNQDISDWDVSSVIDMSSMFSHAESFNQDISDWDVDNVTDMSSMFRDAGSFNQDISSWDVENVTDMSYMFRDARSFNEDISEWEVENVTDMSRMFNGAEVFNQDISEWNVGSVEYMDHMFDSAKNFNQNISGWDVKSVIDMDDMFNGAQSFNQDISGWDVSSVIDHDDFDTGSVLDQEDLPLFDVMNPSLTITDDTEGTAYGEVKYTFTFDEDVSKFTVDDVTVTGGSKGVFTQVSDSLYTLVVTPDANSIEDITVDVAVNVALDSAENPNNAATQNVQKVNSNPALTREKLDTLIANYKSDPIDANAQAITEANVSEITDMNFLFTYDIFFDLDISSWDVSGVTNMYGMFYNAQSFNQDISGWDVGEVIDMDNMFDSAESFNQDISDWDVSNVTEFNSFYSNSALDQNNVPDVFDVTNPSVNNDLAGAIAGGNTFTFSFDEDVVYSGSGLHLYLDTDFDGTIESDYTANIEGVLVNGNEVIVGMDANFGTWISHEKIDISMDAGTFTDNVGNEIELVGVNDHPEAFLII